MPKCKRCGACCYVFDGKSWEKCRFLKQMRDKKYKCLVYHSRINRFLGHGFYCDYIQNNEFRYPNCEFNHDKPMHPRFKQIF